MCTVGSYSGLVWVAPLSENCLGGGAWLHIEMLGSLNRFGLDEIGPYIPRVSLQISTMG